MSITQSQYAKHSGLTKGRVSQLVKAGMPLDSLEAADQFRNRALHAPNKPPPVTETTPMALARPEAAKDGLDTNLLGQDGPEGAYERQKAIERSAYDMAARAVQERSSDAARLIQVHTQAAKNLTDAREQVLKLRELEKSLVSGIWVRKMMTEHDGAVVTLVRAMPKQLAGRILPHDPEFAETELDRWVQETFLKTFSDTDPWKETQTP